MPIGWKPDFSIGMSRYDLTDFEWRVIEPLLPNKPRGVPRVDDRRVLNGIFWVLRSGAPWRDLPERYGPRTTCYNRFVRWRKAGVWDRLRSRSWPDRNRGRSASWLKFFGMLDTFDPMFKIVASRRAAQP